MKNSAIDFEAKLTNLSYSSQLLLVFLIYLATAEISQLFAIEPGNISPIWLPSGFMVVAVFILGYRVWPAIFVAAMVANAGEYISLYNLQNFTNALAAGALNGAGDALGITGSVWLYKKITDSEQNFLTHLRSFSFFLAVCCLGGSIISAAFGISGLVIFGFLDSTTSASFSFLTWVVGDAGGVLLIGVLTMSLLFEKKPLFSFHRNTELYTFIICWVAIFVWEMFFLNSTTDFLPSPKFFAVPMILWSILRFGFRVTFSILALEILFFTVDYYDGIGQSMSHEEMKSFVQHQLYLILLAATAAVIGIINAQKINILNKLKHQYEHDPLTGAYSRPYFQEAFNKEYERIHRAGNSFGLIMFDIDDFKHVNDSFGHATGDRILTELTKLIDKELRTIDVLTRWGGEEFVILLPDTDKQGALALAERCRKKVSGNDFKVDQKITISLGICLANPNHSIEEHLTLVDEALYNSKDNGKNIATLLHDFIGTQEKT